jgi:hypothetical protein
LQKPSQINGDSTESSRFEARRNYGIKKEKYFQDKNSKLEKE